MKKVAILPGALLAAMLFSGAGLSPAPAHAAASVHEAASAAAPGDVSNAVPRLAQPGGLAPAPSGPVAESAPRNPSLLANCTFTVLANDNSTSGNERCPTLRNRFGRSVYLITAAELAANGLVSGSSVSGIGWNYQTAQGVTASTPLIIYLQNTSDVTNTKSTTWATAITGMTVVHNAATTLPSPAGTFDIAFSGGSPFTYTGGGLYVAFDCGQYTGTLSTTTVAWCNSLGLVNGLLGNQSNTAAPTTLAASSFRPETRLTAGVPNNDVSVDIVATYGVVPLGLASPVTVQATITNKGSNTQTSLPVTLNITGAESFTNTQTIASLAACGGQTIVTFAPFTPSVTGTDVVTVTVPADDVAGNNSKGTTFSVNLPQYSYKIPGSTASGGFGLGVVGTIVAKFSTVAATNVTQITPEFFATSATAYRLAIFKDSGVGTPGSLLYEDASNRTVTATGPVTITLPSPVAVGPGNFFVGLVQNNTTNMNLSFDTEAPIRGGQFFLGAGNTPTTWSDFLPGNNFKPNIAITVDRCNITPTVSNNGPICSGGTLQLSASAAGAGTYSWTGPNGFTSTQQNPSIPGATSVNSGTYTVTVNGCSSGGTASTVAVVNTGPYSINSSAAAGGTISPSGSVSVACGGSQTFTVSPGACSNISDVLVDGVSQGAIASYTFSNVTANHTIFASFSLKTFTITASAGSGGTISPSGSVSVNCGSSQSFTISPSTGFQVSDVLVDGVSQGAISSYTFSSVTANHTIAASFSQAPAVIAGQSTATYICPTNTCVTIPVNLTRTYTTAVLAYSVSFQLSGNLSLCSGTSSVTEGTFLSGSGPTLYHVIDHGGGSYTVDDALTSGCGPTATSGLLFNVAVTSSAATGPGTLTVTSVSLRNCSNQLLAASPGAAATVPIDNQAPAVTVTSPNGGEVLPVGSSFAITWTATDNSGVANVDLAYSTDGGATYPNVIATAIPNSGSYAWTVPSPKTTQARVRVTAHDVACSSTSDASDANFTIGTQTITATAGAHGSISPSGAVTVPYGANQSFTISPDPGYQIADVLVDGSSVGAVASYTFSNVTADHTIAASFSLIPAVIGAQSTATYLCPSNTCVTLPVTISRAYTNPVLGFSVTFQLSANLSLCSGTSSVTEGTFLSSSGPTFYQVVSNGGGSYTVDDALLSNCGPTATSGTLFSIGVTSSAATGPGTITITAIKLRDCSNGDLAANPGPPGTVPIDNQAPSVTVTSPNGGEVWPIGTSQSITWTATDNTGVASVDLAYSTDGGATYPHAIATGISNSGSFAWTVPNTPTTTARVRVTAHDAACGLTASDASDANFTIRNPIITASAGSGGTISPSGAVSVPYGGSQTFTISPSDKCVGILDVTVDGVSQGPISSYTFTNVTTDHTIAATFTPLGPFTITATAGPGGSISPSGAVSVTCGAAQTFTISPSDDCHVIADVTVDGISQGAISSYTFTDVQANHTINASFTLLGPYTITASAGPNGSINPNGAVSVACGANQTFTIAADPCYHIVDVLVDGSSVGAVASYTFMNVHANHTIAASFAHDALMTSGVTGLTAVQVKSGNDASGRTRITITYTTPAGAALVEVWRKGYGSYPTYDDGGGSVPTLPATYPPAGWTLTGVTASGQTDQPGTRDFWYYVAYAKDGCGNVAPVSNMTGGTLDYHLGDVSDGVTPGQGNNQVTTADISLLGSHYGASGGALAPFNYLDVGPTTDNSTNGRPTTDARADFEDLVMFALNYFPQVSAPRGAAGPVQAAAADEIAIEAPDAVAAGEVFEVRVWLAAAGDLQAVSAALAWDAAVVTPLEAKAGELVTSQGGVMFSPGPGGVDAALLGVGEHGMIGEGVLATVRFRAVAAGAPGLSMTRVIGRNASNRPVDVKIGETRRLVVNTTTSLMPASPNPTHGSSLLQYSLARSGPVDLSIYSVDGRRVRTLVHGVGEAGQYQQTWDGTDERGGVMRSGVFYVRLDAAGTRLTRMITLVR